MLGARVNAATPFGAARREDDAVPLVLERLLGEQAVRLVVVDDQDGRGVGRRLDISLAIVRFGDRRPSTATSENLPNTAARALVFFLLRICLPFPAGKNQGAVPSMRLAARK